jgi:hypothetical protein
MIHSRRESFGDEVQDQLPDKRISADALFVTHETKTIPGTGLMPGKGEEHEASYQNAVVASC